MTWLFPAVLSTLIASLLLSGAYGYLFYTYRERFLKNWFIAWSIHSLRYVFLLLILHFGQSPLLYFTNLSMIVISLFFLWKGTTQFIGKETSPAWKIVILLVLAWVALAVFADFSFLLLSVPLFGFFACVDIWVGYQILRSTFSTGIGKKIVGITFIFWGVHQADYPLLRPIEWFAPFGYMIGTTCSLIIALGMMILFFERVRQDLEMNKSYLRQLFEDASYGIALALPESGIITDCNAAFAAMLGKDKNEIIGRRQKDFHPPEEQEGDVSKTFKQHLIDKRGQPLESQMISATGDLIDVEIKANLIDFGNDQYVQCFFRDITERKQAENELSTIKADLQNTFDISPGLICVANIKAGYFVRSNPAVTTILGYTEEEFTSKPIVEFVHPDDRERTIQEVSKQLEGNPIAQFQNRYQCKDGSYKWLSWGGSKADKDGNVYAVATDISQLKRAETEHRELDLQLRQKYKMEAVGVMAAGIAHNFNNSLSIILGNLELSKLKVPLQSNVGKYLDNAITAVLRSRDLVKQIMNYSRKEPSSESFLKFALLVKETFSLLKATIPSSVNFSLEISPDCQETYLLGNSSQLQECLVNLCNNAVQAMHDQGELNLKLSKIELTQKDFPDRNCPAGSYLHLRVKDSGCGIPDEIKDKIFDPFFTTKEIHEGTGMGLSSVQGIVEKHHGMIYFENNIGQGTIFHLYFPVTVQQKQEKGSGQELELQQGSETILYVDDNEMLAKLTEKMLEQMGYDVTVKTDSLEALQLFMTNVEKFDLIITDQIMPNLTGKELIQKIKKLRPDIPTILCTGYSTRVNEKDAKESGISAFLMKPMEGTELSRTIRAVFEKNK